MSVAQNSDLDLFAQAPLSSSSRAAGKPFLLTMMRGRERVILLAICFIVTIAASYSAGYEQGRRLTRAARERSLEMVTVPAASTPAVPVRMTTVSSTPAQANRAPVNRKVQAAPAAAPAPAAIPSIATDVYTVQLASYRSRESAERESAALKKNGLSPLLLTKGEYVVLCVGNFSQKQAARPLQAQLSKRYQGCYIRRI